MPELNLLKSYPSGKGTRYKREYTIEQRLEARKFGMEFFDGNRDQGYGGYIYDGRWAAVAKDFIEHYHLTSSSRVLDVGCAKGFLLFEITKLLPGIEVIGIDISEYCIENAMPELKGRLFICSADNMPFKQNEFDLVISINTVHNLPFEACLKSVIDIENIGKNKYIQVDSWRNVEEKESFRMWQVTGGFYDIDRNWVPLGTAFSVMGWIRFFELAKYTGEYYWTILETLKAGR